MIEVLLNTPQFKELPRELLEELSAGVERVQHSSGEMVFREGDDGDALYVVEQGTVEIRKSGRLLTVFRSGQTFGEMALYEKAKRSADAACSESTTLLRISHEAFRGTLFDHPRAGIAFLLHGLGEMSRRLRRTSEYLVTVYGTGRIVGAGHTPDRLCERIVERLIQDMDQVCGGMILVRNQVTGAFDEMARQNVLCTDSSRICTRIGESTGMKLCFQEEGQTLLGLPFVEEGHVLGYIFVAKEEASGPFSSEEEIIVSAVADQVGMGILNALHRDEEDARKRLEWNRMRR